MYTKAILMMILISLVYTNVSFSLTPEEIGNISLLANKTDTSYNILIQLFNRTNTTTYLNTTYLINNTINTTENLTNTTIYINSTYIINNTILMNNLTYSDLQLLEMILRVNLSLENEKIFLQNNLTQQNSIYDSRFQNIWDNYPDNGKLDQNLSQMTLRTDIALSTNFKTLSDIDTRNFFIMIFMFAGSVGFTFWGFRKGGSFSKAQKEPAKSAEYYGAEAPVPSRMLSAQEDFTQQKKRIRELQQYVLSAKAPNFIKIDVIENYINTGICSAEKDIDSQIRFLSEKERVYESAAKEKEQRKKR